MMNKNKLTIVIDRPIGEVFEFTINPKNTPLWISHIKIEESSEYPPKIKTVYRNRGEEDNWDKYEVIGLKANSLFTLQSSDKRYFVRYTYEKINDKKTKMEYFEWVKSGELDNPFTQKVLEKLKEVIESS